MSLLVRDNKQYTPRIGSGIESGSLVDALAMSGAAGRFTEPIDVGTFTEGIAFIKAASSAGTSPTIDCDLQIGFLDSNNQFQWKDSGDSFTQITANGVGFKRFTSNFGKYIRFRLTLGGTNTPGYTVTMRVVMKG
jgi:hypothetical protein